MSPINRNILFAFTKTLRLTISAVEMLNMASLVAKANFRRNKQLVDFFVNIFGKRNRLIQMSDIVSDPGDQFVKKVPIEQYSRKLICKLPNKDRNNSFLSLCPYRVDGEPMWQIFVSAQKFIRTKFYRVTYKRAQGYEHINYGRTKENSKEYIPSPKLSFVTLSLLRIRQRA